MRFLFLLLLSLQLTCAYSAPRIWTDTEGRSIEAELIAADPGNNTIDIRRSDGRTFALGWDRLSEEDRAYVEKWVREKMAHLEPGSVHRREVPGKENTRYHYWIPPHEKPLANRPILILFSPSGAGAAILDQVKPACEEVGWITVGVDFLRNRMLEAGFSSEAQEAIFDAVLQDIQERIPHDPHRIYLGGFSGGAVRAYNLTTRRREPFAGVLAFGGWLGGEESRARAQYRRQMAVAIINGEQDRGANAHSADDRAALERRNCRVRLFPFPGGHVVAPPEVTARAVAWMEEDWNARGIRHAGKQ
jgi:dienelactone hydrolase